jgi:large subunit ribosomal protein L35
MPKKKTHKGAAKRFKLTGTGKIMHKKIGASHLMSSKSPKRKRHLRQEDEVKSANVKTVRRLIG